MAGGMELIFAMLCNTTLDGAVNTTTALNSTLVPVKSNSWLELGNQRTISALKEFNGKHLKIATYDNYPMSSVVPDPKKNGSIIGRGVAFSLMRLLTKKLNFTYEIVLPKRNFVMGGSSPDDSLIGLVSSGKVDMAVAFVPNIIEFRKLVSFSSDLDEEIWVMLMKRPPESAVGEGMLAPFTKRVWQLILIAVAIFGPCITILTRIRAKLIPYDEPPISLYPTMWFVFGALLKQSSRLAPKATSTRVLFMTWWMFIMLISSFYMANLTAFLTLSEFTLDIDQPTDLYRYNIPWIATEGSAVQYTVTSVKTLIKPKGVLLDGYHRLIYFCCQATMLALFCFGLKPQMEDLHYLKEMVRKKRGQFYDSTNITEYLKLVDKGYVLVKSYNSVVYGIYSDYMAKAKKGVPEENRCTYVIASNPFLRNLRGFIFPKDSKLKDLFNRAIGLINQGGLVNLLKTWKLPLTKMCPMNLKSKERKLQNTDLLMTYKITVVGMSAAIAVFIGEIIVKRYFSPKSTQKTKGKKKGKKTKFNKNTTVHYYEDDDSRPPPYETIFGKASKIKLPKNAHKKIVNGREYLVVNTKGGMRLIPVRSPSALLYKVEMK